MEKGLKFLLDAEIADDRADPSPRDRSDRRTYAYMACGSGGGGCRGCCGGGRYTEESADKKETGVPLV